jgi:hypothetical protein
MDDTIFKRAVYCGALIFFTAILLACKGPTGAGANDLEIEIDLSAWLHNSQIQDVPISVTGELLTNTAGSAPKKACVVGKRLSDKTGNWNGFAVYANATVAKTEPEHYLLRAMQISNVTPEKESTIEISCRAKCQVRIGGLEKVNIVQSKGGKALTPSMVLDSEDIGFTIKERGLSATK